jgi:phenylalanyl-tRNA synthetase beta chain
MKISYAWLQEYLDLDGVSPERLADLLTMSGLEVEDLTQIGQPLDGVVVGQVLATRPHPNADRLTLCEVDLGNGAPVQIVCGAPNVAAGQKVPVATVGTTLLLPSKDRPGERKPVTLVQAKLRGEVSHGMICAEDELGLSDDHSGILVLAPEARVGQPLADYLAVQGMTAVDYVLDVNITPNRPDAISHLGIARDLSALLNRPLRRPVVPLPAPGGAVAQQVKIEVEAPDGCPRYVGVLVRGVRIGPSPAWMQQRLRALGLRPISNVVDVTNYVMYECGQPLHAFDFDQLAEGTVRVRLTAEVHPFTTLDDKQRTLPAGTLMICDGAREVAIAGVMGGLNSEVTTATVNVLIESAFFQPSYIRRTAKALGLQTDASYRFERHVDPAGQAWAAMRAALLMVETAGSTLVPGLLDVHPRPAPARSVQVRPRRVQQVLGVDVPPETQERLLSAIGFQREEAAAVNGGDTVAWTIPSFRPDITREVDMIEEVARLYGFEHIPEPPQSHLPNLTPRTRPVDMLRQRVLALLPGLGYRELYTNSMLRREVAAAFCAPLLPEGATAQVVETLNPISQEMAALRPSLLPGVLQVMTFNRNHGQQALRFFEFGHVFRKAENGQGLIPGYAEHEALLIALSGPASRTGWDTPAREADLFDLKGTVEALLETLGLQDVAMTPAYAETSLTGYHLTLTAGETVLGHLARLSDEQADASDLRAPVYFAELDWEALVQQALPTLDVRYAPVSRFPVVARDLAAVVARETPVGPLLATIRAAGRPLLREAAMFDLYVGEPLAPDQKSVAFTLRFGADRTLLEEEVEAALAVILAALRDQHGAVLRQ